MHKVTRNFIWAGLKHPSVIDNVQYRY